MSNVRVLWQDMSEERRQLWWALLFGFLASASVVALLGTSGYLISKAAEMPPVLTLTVAAAMVRGYAVSRSVFRYAERLAGHDAAFRGLSQVRVRVYEGLERITPIGLARFTRGDLLARLGADVDSATDLPLRVVLPWAQAALVAVGATAWVVFLLPTSGAWLAVLSLLMVTLVPWWLARGAARVQRRIAPAQAKVTESVVSSIDGATQLSAYGMESDAVASVKQADDRVIALTNRESFSVGIGAGVTTAVQGVAVFLALLSGVPAVTSGVLDPVWLAVVAFIPLALFEVLGTVPPAALALQRLRGSADRIAQITEITDSALPPQAELAPGFHSLVVKDLSVRWPNADHDAVRHISFAVKPGQRVGIVGPSGSGKSSLAAALMGFLPYSGSATLNGVEIRDAGSDQVCAAVGLLAQRSHIFETSIRGNVTIARPHASDHEITRAYENAQLAHWIDSLPEGQETEVGSLGVNISGGEQQRVGLARVLLADRHLVVLDEPTEHLDAHTAQGVNTVISQATHNSTAIIISHDISSLADVDVVLELSHGEVTAIGSPADLLTQGGWFAAQWQREQERASMQQLLTQLPANSVASAALVRELLT